MISTIGVPTTSPIISSTSSLNLWNNNTIWNNNYLLYTPTTHHQNHTSTIYNHNGVAPHHHNLSTTFLQHHHISLQTLDNNNNTISSNLSEILLNNSDAGGDGDGDDEGGGYYPVFPSYIRNTSMIFCVIIMCLGVIGNVMVPIVILKTKDMRNSTNIFLVNLSVADLLVLLVCTPTVLVEVNSRPETWVLGEEMCK